MSCTLLALTPPPPARLLVRVQTAFTCISVACTGPRLKHVTAGVSSKRRHSHCDHRQERWIQQVSRSAGVQCLRRRSDITCRRSPSKDCGSRQKWTTGVYVVHIRRSSNWDALGTMVLLLPFTPGELAEGLWVEASFWWFRNQPF